MKAHSTESRSLLDRLERLEADSKADLWKKRHVIGVWLGVSVTLLTLLLSTFRAYRTETNQRNIEVKQLLDTAWDTLGGQPGTTVIRNYVEDPQQHEIAHRLIEEAGMKDPNSARVHQLEAAYFQARGNLEEAENSYQSALELDPESAATHLNLGAVLQLRGNLPAAESSFRRSLALEPEEAIGHSNLGLVLYARNNLEEAEKSFRQAISLKSDDAESHANLGRVLQAQGRITEAEASYRSALQHDPNYELAHSKLKELAKGFTDGFLNPSSPSSLATLEQPPRMVPPRSPPRLFLPAQPVTAVLAIGDPLLAAPLEAAIEGRLLRARLDVRDEPETADDLARSKAPKSFGELLSLLEQEGFHFLVMIHVEEGNSRKLRSRGQQMTLIPARLRLSAHFLPTRQAFGRDWTELVEYTELSADAKAGQAFLGPTADLIYALRSDWQSFHQRSQGS